MTNTQLENYELNHERGGGPWFMVEDVDDEYCQLVASGKDVDVCARSVVYLAWKPKLSIYQLPDKDNNYEMIDCVIKPSILKDLNVLRQKIREGKLRKKNNRLVGCK